TDVGVENLIQTRCVRLLLEHGANVNLRTVRGDSPLMTAADRYLPEITRMLLAKGAAVNQKNVDGRTALGWAENQHLRLGENTGGSPKYEQTVSLLKQAGGL